MAPVLPVRLREHPVTEEHLTKLTSRGISVVPTARRRPSPPNRPSANPSRLIHSTPAVVMRSVPSSSAGSSTASAPMVAQRDLAAQILGAVKHKISLIDLQAIHTRTTLAPRTSRATADPSPHVDGRRRSPLPLQHDV